MSLLVDYCDHKAARYAVERWHYSKRMPSSKLVKFGVWEDSEFIGVVMFGSGANNGLGKSYGLTQFQTCELVRIALKEHSSPVSKITRCAIKLIKKDQSGLRLIVSFADPEHDHLGTIYQAMNWIYAGMTDPADEWIVNGKRWHGRGLRSTFKGMGWIEGTTFERAKRMDVNAQKIKGSSKHRYLYPLDKGMRRQILPLAQPYPKRGQGVNGDTPAVQAGGAGSIPAVRLDMTGQEPELVSE